MHLSGWCAFPSDDGSSHGFCRDQQALGHNRPCSCECHDLPPHVEIQAAGRIVRKGRITVSTVLTAPFEGDPNIIGAFEALRTLAPETGGGSPVVPNGGTLLTYSGSAGGEKRKKLMAKQKVSSEQLRYSYGLTFAQYKRTFNAGYAAWRRASAPDDSDPDMDQLHDAYRRKTSIAFGHPRSHAWLDGYFQGDYGAAGWLEYIQAETEYNEAEQDRKEGN